MVTNLKAARRSAQLARKGAAWPDSQNRGDVKTPRSRRVEAHRGEKSFVVRWMDLTEIATCLGQGEGHLEDSVESLRWE